MLESAELTLHPAARMVQALPPLPPAQDQGVRPGRLLFTYRLMVTREYDKTGCLKAVGTRSYRGLREEDDTLTWT